VVETSYRKVETGDYYDFIAKAVRKSYRYDEVKGPAAKLTATADGAGHFELSFPAPDDKTFQVTVRVTDPAGRTSHHEEYLGSSIVFPDFTQLSTEDYGPHKVGDQLDVVLRHGPDALPSGGDNRYLFLRAQRGIRSYAINDGPRYRTPFADDDVPSVSLLGVRFTGDTYDLPSEPLMATLDEATRRLEVKVTPEKPRYAPVTRPGWGFR